MTEFNGHNKIVSLEEFKRRIRPPKKTSTSTTEVTPTYQGFQPAGHVLFHAVRHALTQLHGEPPDKDKYVLAMRVNRPGEGTQVLNVTKGGRDFFAVSMDPNDREIFTEEMERRSDPEARVLMPPLRDFPVVLQVANHVLRRDQLIQRTDGITPPRVGPTELHLQGQREKDVTTWRAASRYAIDGVGPKQPQLRKQIEGHLGDILHWHHLHLDSVEKFARLQGLRVPTDRSANSDMFIGACNPLLPFDLRHVLVPDPEKDEF